MIFMIKKNSDKRLYKDLRRGQDYTGELEKLTEMILIQLLRVTDSYKKMRLRVIGYYHGEYIIMVDVSYKIKPCW